MTAKKNKAEKRTGSIQVFGNALVRLIVGFMKYSNVDGIITEVNESTYTATVKIGDVLFYEVPLRVLISAQASFVEIPKLNTQCVIVFRDASKSRPYIMEVHECSKILYKVGESSCEITDGLWKFNGGTLGGMVKLDAIVSSLNRIEDFVNSHKHSDKMQPPTYTIDKTSKSDLENTKIKQ